MREGKLLENLVGKIFDKAGFDVQYNVILSGYEVDVYAKYEDIDVLIECKEYGSAGLDIPGLIYEWSGKNKKINAKKIILAIYGPNVSEKQYDLAEEEKISIWDTEKIETFLSELPKGEEALRNLIFQELGLGEVKDIPEIIEIPLTEIVKKFKDKNLIDKEPLSIIKQIIPVYEKKNHHLATKLINKALKIEPEDFLVIFCKFIITDWSLGERGVRIASKILPTLTEKEKEWQELVTIISSQGAWGKIDLINNIKKSLLKLLLRLKRIENFVTRKMEEATNSLDSTFKKASNSEKAKVLRGMLRKNCTSFLLGKLKPLREALEESIKTSNEFYEVIKDKIEPDGFRGIKWGTPPLRDMAPYLLESPRFSGNIRLYIRKNDKLKIGGAILQSINYNFYKGKFYKIIISTQSSDNFEALKEVLFKKFGPVEKNQEEGMWIWFGNITRAYLWYDESSETGHFVMSSIEISTQEEADKEQEVKEGAETGF